MLKNDLLLQALAGKPVTRPPIWFMRQAGRYLPEYLKLREKYDFFTRCQTPELAAEITIQPIKRFGLDAAILFSDILVVPQAMGVGVELKENVGPLINTPLADIIKLQPLTAAQTLERLDYVMQAIRLTKQMLADTVPLIGFAGAPWTIFCYLIEGSGSKNFIKAKTFCLQHPEQAKQILQAITTTTINYLHGQIKAGVNAIQLFDSWAGVLAPEQYLIYSWHYSAQIITALAAQIPIIMFAKGAWHCYKTFSNSPVAAIGVDWGCPPDIARQLSGEKTLQGNLDPALLFLPPQQIKQLTSEMIKNFGCQRYIANLGHGILPATPLDGVAAFVETVQNYSQEN